MKFDKSRFRRYVGSISEMVAEEILLKQGFDAWLLKAYFPYGIAKKLVRSGLIHYLYRQCRDFKEVSKQVRENIIKELNASFGDKLEPFKQYMEELGFSVKEDEGIREGMTYIPDLVAKKNREIYVIEVKANTGFQFLKEEKLKGLMLAKEYGFVPTVITLTSRLKQLI